MINLILCGGSGTRLWPLSRKLFPKQFYKMLGDLSLFQQTIHRNQQVTDRSLIITNKDHYFMAIDQIDEMSKGNRNKFSYLLEPVGRNTAPAIALACFDLNPEEIVLITPADHLIKDEDAYRKAVKLAEKIASDNKLVTFGIKPVYAETGYGYIEADASKSDSESSKVKQFHEKPSQEKADAYLKAGNFYWNSGMFVFKAGVFLDELKKYAPEIYNNSKVAYERALSEKQSSDEHYTIKISEHDMLNIPSNSIDYAVMEESDLVQVIPVNIGWNDLGSFDSLYEVKEKDSSGNTLDENLISIDSKNNLIISQNRTIATVDMENCIIVDTPDALLVGKMGSSQLVKKAVEKLQLGNAKQMELTEVHSTVHRPWGTYTVLEDNDNFKIKRIVVKPGKRLSLQKHMHRSEHWTVVSGTATVRVGEREMTICRNESTYISIGEVHRLGNDGKIDLAIIETQVGEYLGEDDIIRLSDDFKRE